MKPQRQLIKHDPDNGLWGDCHRTCIAVILDLDAADVPHFNDRGSTDDAPEREWLAGRGLRAVSMWVPGGYMDLALLLESLENCNPGVPAILGCTSTVAQHSVVVCGGRIACNPSDSDIVGPMDDGHWWLTYFVPLGICQ